MLDVSDDQILRSTVMANNVAVRDDEVVDGEVVEEAVAVGGDWLMKPFGRSVFSPRVCGTAAEQCSAVMADKSIVFVGPNATI